MPILTATHVDFVLVLEKFSSREWQLCVRQKGGGMSGRECWRKWLSFGYQFLRVSSCQLEPKQKPHFDNRSYLFQMGDAGMDAAASEGGSTPPPPTTNHARVAAKLSSSSSSSFHPPNSIMTPATKNCQHFHLPPRGGNSVTTARTRRRCKTGKGKKKLPWKRRTRPSPPPLQQPLGNRIAR